MGLLSFFKKNEDTGGKVGGMQDYMMLIRVYFQASLAAQIGINNIAMLPDLRVFKNTFKVKTEHNKLGLGEKTVCKKMLKNLYEHDDNFFREIDKSISKNCKKIQDVQTYLYQFQGFTQDMMMLVSNLMKFKLRVPSFFKGFINREVQKTVHEIFTKIDYTDAATIKSVASVRKYNQRLAFSEDWISQFVFQVVMLAKKEKQPQQENGKK